MGIGEHLDALKQHWARNFAFLDYFKKVYSRHQPLPRWSDADIDEFIASDPVYGPRLKALRESRNFALGGALVGGAHLGGVAFKYSKSPHVDVANVDPVDVARSFKDLDPESTLVVVVSKTFTTAETMLNARTLKEWIISSLGPQAVAKHMIAVSTNLKLMKEFGIDPNNAFAFWDWVGGRYSVCSAVGVLPLSLHYGFPIVQKSQLWQDKNPVLLWSTY